MFGGVGIRFCFWRDCLAGFTQDDTGVCVADVDAEEEETNWLLYGGIAALVVVGGVMAKKMMK